MPQSTSDQGENFEPQPHQPGPAPARPLYHGLHATQCPMPRSCFPSSHRMGGKSNVWFGGTEYHVLVPCWPGQAARAGVLQGPFFSVLGQAGWGPPKAQMSSPAHPLVCISWETWLSGSLSTREAVWPGASPWSFLGLWVTSLDPDFLA